MKKYFNLDKISTLEELKREFKRLALVYHPDRGGNIVEFQNLNNEYEKLYHIYQQKSTRKDEKNENVNTYRDILNQSFTDLLFWFTTTNHQHAQDRHTEEK